jgi:hypothetical protein
VTFRFGPQILRVAVGWKIARSVCRIYLCLKA